LEVITAAAEPPHDLAVDDQVVDADDRGGHVEAVRRLVA
jgi:hypothetical protein